MILMKATYNQLIIETGNFRTAVICTASGKNILKEKVSAIGVSTVGGVFHNLGQLIVTAIVIKNIGILSYLPFLSIAGIGTGIFIGITANYLLKHMKALNNLDYHRNMAN